MKFCHGRNPFRLPFGKGCGEEGISRYHIYNMPKLGLLQGVVGTIVKTISLQSQAYYCGPIHDASSSVDSEDRTRPKIVRKIDAKSRRCMYSLNVMVGGESLRRISPISRISPPPPRSPRLRILDSRGSSTGPGSESMDLGRSNLSTGETKYLQIEAWRLRWLMPLEILSVQIPSDVPTWRARYAD